MSAAFCCIFRLFHRAKHQAADHCFIWKSLDTLNDLLDFLWCDLFLCFLNLHSLIMKKCQKTLYFLRIRIIMSSVYKWNLLCTVFLCHCLICHQHEILNNLRCHICLVWFYINGFSCGIENDLAFRKIKINGASVVSAASDDLRQFFHHKEHRNQCFISLLRILVRIFKNVLYICIAHSLIYVNHCLRNLMRNYLTFFINVHQTA